MIQAPSGYGKSMLAHRLATGADNGCGWFLKATDLEELTRSLAQAERGEHALGGERPRPGGEKADAGEDPAFAAAALDRLRTAMRPWVVVVDNCDSPPDTRGLADRIPKPHALGQVVIVTTTDPGWLAYATNADCQVRLAGIGAGDLGDLKLPAGLSDAVAGRPLVALALTALRDRGGVLLPEASGLAGPELVWDLLRNCAEATGEAVELARLLAWLPPEPMPRRSLVEIAGWDTSPGDALVGLGFVTWSASAVPDLSADRADPADSGGLGLLMHRLFATAVRQQTWLDVPNAAADSIARLLTTTEGRWLFITAADVSALVRLEPPDKTDQPGGPGEVELAIRQLADHPRPGTQPPGLLWYGLGHVRERRGPVRASKVPFQEAAKLLDKASYAYELSESQIGLARVVFQDPRATDPELSAARDAARAAQRMLTSLVHPDAPQLCEQGSALSWLIERRLAGHEPDLATREARFTEIRANLWLSFAERLRIARGQTANTPVAPDAVPSTADGLGSERAFFNLAGTDVGLGKLRHELALRMAEAAGRQLAVLDESLQSADQSFREAERVYNVVRELREQRYGGRAHPHLAACLHGLAIVGYYKAALLGEVGELAGAAGNAVAALDQRLQIARSLSGAEADSALLDGDVRKSVDLLLKIMAGAVLSRSSELGSGSADVARLIGEAVKEWTVGPGRMAAEVQVPESGGGAPPDDQPQEDQPQETERPKTRLTQVDFGRESPAGFMRDAPRRPRPRYLSASYPDAVQLGVNFGLEVAVVLSRGAGRRDAPMADLEVGPTGKRLLLSIHARGMTVKGDHEQSILVPAAADSSPVRFELAGTVPGVHPIRLRAWDEGSCVGELLAEVTVGADAGRGPDRTLTGQIEASAIPAEITLEVSHEFANGQNYYQFRLRDPETEPRMVTLPLRSNPDTDVDTLILRLNDLADTPGTRQDILTDLRLEGKQLWDRMVPAAVHEQFWQCQDRISQLTILTDDDAFPWELLYPRDKANDAGFLVAQGFPVTRRIHAFRRQLSLRRHPARFVLPEGAPAHAEAEVNAIREILGAREPNISTLRELRGLINSGSFGVLHFACHGNFSRNYRGPQVHLDRPFLLGSLADAQDNWQAPLVFLNACRSAGPRSRCIGLDNFADGFLKAGAGAFIGSLWEVRDGTASEFAQELYAKLNADVTLGDAVAELRGKVTKRGDPTWLAYAVYGHPQAKLM